MNAELLERLVSQLNMELDFPWVSETQEAAVIRWVLQRVSAILPESVLILMADAADGLDDEEIQRMEDIVVKTLNVWCDIPLLPESAEEKVIRPIVRSVLALATEGAELK